jgi:hypothetical protein
MRATFLLSVGASLLYGQSVVAQTTGTFDATAALAAYGVNVTYPPMASSSPHGKVNTASTSSSSSSSPSAGCIFSVSLSKWLVPDPKIKAPHVYDL